MTCCNGKEGLNARCPVLSRALHEQGVNLHTLKNCRSMLQKKSGTISALDITRSLHGQRYAESTRNLICLLLDSTSSSPLPLVSIGFAPCHVPPPFTHHKISLSKWHHNSPPSKHRAATHPSSSRVSPRLIPLLGRLINMGSLFVC